MEQSLHSPEVYDFRRYDRIWQRVAPALEPYPAQGQGNAVPAFAAGQSAGQSISEVPMEPTDLTPAQLRQESQLPGAEVNPCCMGSAAAEMLAVLTGFIEEELENQRQYLTLSRQAPAWARQRLRDMAAEEGNHAQRLMAVHYLITGTCYRPAISRECVRFNGWCAALRERYHAAACGGFNYRRAADETTDPCLSGVLHALSGEEYRHADTLLMMLEKSLRR